MDISVFLEPVPEKCFSNEVRPGKLPYSETLTIYRNESSFPNLNGVHLALVGVKDERGVVDNKGCSDGVDYIRKAFYSLFDHHSELNIVDVGNVKSGKDVNDTYYAVNQVLTELFKHNIVPIIIGAGQDITFPMYQVYEPTGKLVNITAIDSMFDLGNDRETLNSRSYLSHIILHQPNFLFNYTNIGYQSYYVSASNVDLMKQLLFEAYRLGSVKNIDLTEPLIRNANILTFDIASVRAADAPGVKNASPNGFSGEDVCRMARYAGLSYKLSSIGFFEYNPHYDINSRTAYLIAEMIWYFIEGFTLRTNDIPKESIMDDFTRYLVQIDEWQESLVFLCHKYTGKWWMDITINNDELRLPPRHHYIPCSKEDYDLAMHNELPDKWWQFYQKLM